MLLPSSAFIFCLMFSLIARYSTSNCRDVNVFCLHHSLCQTLPLPPLETCHPLERKYGCGRRMELKVGGALLRLGNSAQG